MAVQAAAEEEEGVVEVVEGAEAAEEAAEVVVRASGISSRLKTWDGCLDETGTEYFYVW